MATLQELPPVKGVKNIQLEELYPSCHRTCQGCESAVVMRLMIKAAGALTIVLRISACSYVPMTPHSITPWFVPLMPTQLA